MIVNKANLNDFFLFSRPKSALKGERFRDVEEINGNAATEPTVALSMERFQKTFEKRLDRRDIVRTRVRFEGYIFE